MSPLLPGKPSSPCREQKRTAHPSLTEFLTILHTKLFFFFFITLVQEIWARQASVIENNLSGDAAIGMARSQGLSLPMISAGGVTFNSTEYLWLLRERRQRERQREMESLLFLIPSLLCFLSDLARRQRPVGKEQKASAMLRESQHALSPPGEKYRPQAERLRYWRLRLSTQTAFITWYTLKKYTDLHLTHSLFSPFIIIRGNWSSYWMSSWFWLVRRHDSRVKFMRSFLHIVSLLTAYTQTCMADDGQK